VIELKPSQSEKAQMKYRRRVDNFFSQTVAENNQRINEKNIPNDIADEIKFIESIILNDHKVRIGEI